MPAKTKRARKRKPIPMEELKEYYRVKFTLPDAHEHGGLRYGVVNHSSLDDDVKKHAKKGQLLVSDDEVPTVWTLALDRVEKVPIGNWRDDPATKWLDAKTKVAAQRALKSETLVNQLFSIGVADGSAWYIIVDEGARVLRVEWRGYGADRYTDTLLGWGGRFPRDRIENLVMGPAELKRLIEELDRREKSAEEKAE